MVTTFSSLKFLIVELNHSRFLAKHVQMAWGVYILCYFWSVYYLSISICNKHLLPQQKQTFQVSAFYTRDILKIQSDLKFLQNHPTFTGVLHNSSNLLLHDFHALYGILQIMVGTYANFLMLVQDIYHEQYKFDIDN